MKSKPQPGFVAMLQLGGESVTAHLRECVEFLNTAPAMVDYVFRMLDIDICTYHTINRQAIGRVRVSHKFYQKIWTSKITLRWMPVGHNWQKYNLD